MIRVFPIRVARIVLSKIVSRKIYRYRIKVLHCEMNPARLAGLMGGDHDDRSRIIEEFKGKMVKRFFPIGNEKNGSYQELITSLAKAYPWNQADSKSTGRDLIMKDADLVIRNEFKTLGSELYSFGDNIDWQLDFKSRKRWDLRFYSDIDVLDLGNPSDVKVPWELNRFHQALWLGQAYIVTHDESYAEKFKRLVEDWIASNPVGFGVNWVVPMEAAIRAMNLIASMLFFIGSEKIDDDFFIRFLCTIYEHGKFIRYNLERGIKNGNHYVSDLVGLVYLGMLFHDIRTGRRWLRFAKRELEREMAKQVSPDGTDYEKSTGYQRFVAELFTSAYVLFTRNGIDVSPLFRERLERMFEFISSSTMQNGNVPGIGDADDGRVFRMRSEINFNDHRDILAVAAALFNRSDFKTVSPDFSELGLLLLGTEGSKKFTGIGAVSEVRSQLFKDGGFVFLKNANDYISFDFGDIGMQGRGGHGHNDVLSFTVAASTPLIVDRGTYCYTCNVRLRNRLRSTYSHNTAVVDGVEQAEFKGLWTILEDTTAPDLLAWSSNDAEELIEAQHHGYERLSQPVIHKRKITFNKLERKYKVEDNFQGEGKHKIELMYHFAPGLKVTQIADGFIMLEGNETALIETPSSGSGRVLILENWEHSPSYGVIMEAKTARISISQELPLTTETTIYVKKSVEEVNQILKGHR